MSAPQPYETPVQSLDHVPGPPQYLRFYLLFYAISSIINKTGIKSVKRAHTSYQRLRPVDY